MAKISRTRGKYFEDKVRLDLEKKGWIVDRWGNNCDYPDSNINFPPEERKDMKLIKGKYSPFNRFTGFPDFIAFQEVPTCVYEMMAVECKVNGKLDRHEKEKCKWLIANHIFTKILIAMKGEKRGQIVYETFK